MASSAWRPVVAVAGGTGKVGSQVITALLSPQFSSSFKEVRLLTSNTSSEKAQGLAAKGAKMIGVNYSDEKSILSGIHGADVLVNALGGSVKGFPAKNALMQAAIKDGGIKVYFPSEFGIGSVLWKNELSVDHRSKDFVHAEWDKKMDHQNHIRKNSSIKVCAIYCGLFMEDR